tara:strand:- start:45343 stop:45528 length:186 start_codon:yes stop_codon:yes gene_type:complete
VTNHAVPFGWQSDSAQPIQNQFARRFHGPGPGFVYVVIVDGTLPDEATRGDLHARDKAWQA